MCVSVVILARHALESFSLSLTLSRSLPPPPLTLCLSLTLLLSLFPSFPLSHLVSGAALNLSTMLIDGLQDTATAVASPVWGP